MGLAGEGVIDDAVWIVKSHFPERIGRATFNANKCIVIVRNPLDSIFSLFNMVGTTTHSESLDKEVLDRVMQYTDLWDQFIQQEVTVWADFHTYWIKAPQKLPTHFVKYEDLLENPCAALTEISKFLLNASTLDDFSALTNIIAQITQPSQQVNNSPYKPRSGKINANLHLYSLQQLAFIYSRCNSSLKHIELFGYQKYFE